MAQQCAPGHVEVWHFIVDVDELLVLLHDRVHRVRVVVNGRVGRHLAKRRVFQGTQHVLGETKTFCCETPFLRNNSIVFLWQLTSSFIRVRRSSTYLALFCILSSFTQEEDSQRRCFRLLRHVDNFFETRHTKRHVLGRYTGVVKRVQRHLRRRFSQRLGGQRTHHLSRMNLQISGDENDQSDVSRSFHIDKTTIRPTFRKKLECCCKFHLSQKTCCHHEVGRSLKHCSLRKFATEGTADENGPAPAGTWSPPLR